MHCPHQRKIENEIGEIQKNINKLESEIQKIKVKKPDLLTKWEKWENVEKDFSKLNRRIKEKKNQLEDTPPKNKKEKKRLQNEIGDQSKGLIKERKDKAKEGGNLHSSFFNNGGYELVSLSIKLTEERAKQRERERERERESKTDSKMSLLG